MVLQTRRIVTGVDAQGRSFVVSDGPSPCGFSRPASTACVLMWRTDATPASNEGNADAADGGFPSEVAPPTGSCFYIVSYPPASTHEARAAARQTGAMRVEHRADGLHATDSVDYIVMLSGEITMVLEAGEVTLRAGDTLIDRGVAHAWENRGDVDAVFASIAIGAKPLA